MTVQELIEKLKALPPDLEVCTVDYEMGYVSADDVYVKQVERGWLLSGGPVTVNVAVVIS